MSALPNGTSINAACANKISSKPFLSSGFCLMCSAAICECFLSSTYMLLVSKQSTNGSQTITSYGEFAGASRCNSVGIGYSGG